MTQIIQKLFDWVTDYRARRAVFKSCFLSKHLFQLVLASTLVFRKAIEKYKVKAYGRTLLVFPVITMTNSIFHRSYW